MSVAFREQDQELERELATLEQPPVSLREKIRSFLGQLGVHNS